MTEDRRVAHPAFEAPLRAPAAGAPRRPIDDMTWQGTTPEGVDVYRDRPQTFRVEAPISVEVAPCPGWMRPETYAALLSRLRSKVDAAGAVLPGETIDRKDRWTARHVTVTEGPRKLVSDSSLGDTADTATLVRAALEAAAEARRRGVPLEKLAEGRRRKLLEQ